jgi:hypothetical protein
VKLLYKPFALISGVIASRIGKTTFKLLWVRLDDREPPEPTAPETTFTKVVGAAALEAVTMSTVTATVDRATAAVFHYLFGVWPGKPPGIYVDKDELKAEKKSKKGES